VQVVEPRPNDHTFAGLREGNQPGEERISCTCGWTSVSAPPALLDLDVHFAEVNGISYDKQKTRTAKLMRQLGAARPDPEPLN
jgi:hypothetical protein